MATLKINNNYENNQNCFLKSKENMSLRFKGIILKSLFQKSRLKQRQCLRQCFTNWYIQKSNDKIIKNSIDRFLIAQNQDGFEATRFFYKIKHFVRKQMQKQNDQFVLGLANPSINSIRLNSKRQLLQDNLLDYFQSLKNIFSSKSFQIQNQQRFSRKQLKFKTGVCFNVNQREESQSQRQSQKNLMNQKMSGYSQRLHNLGHKVAFNLVKSVFINRKKMLLLEALNKINLNSQLKRKLAIEYQPKSSWYDLNQPCQQKQDLMALRSTQIQQTFPKVCLMHKQSCQVHFFSIISQKSPNSSQKFSFGSQTSINQSIISSAFTIPSISKVNNQINYVKYSVNLLTQTLKKDKEMVELYQQLNQQYEEFVKIQNQVLGFKLNVKNNIGNLIHHAREKSIKYVLKNAFHGIYYFNRNNTILTTKSKVKIQTAKQILDKELPQISQASICSKNSDITSIKILRIQDKQNIYQQMLTIRNMKKLSKLQKSKQQKQQIKYKQNRTQQQKEQNSTKFNGQPLFMDLSMDSIDSQNLSTQSQRYHNEIRSRVWQTQIFSQNQLLKSKNKLKIKQQQKSSTFLSRQSVSSNVSIRKDHIDRSKLFY